MQNIRAVFRTSDTKIMLFLKTQIGVFFCKQMKRFNFADNRNGGHKISKKFESQNAGNSKF